MRGGWLIARIPPLMGASGESGDLVSLPAKRTSCKEAGAPRRWAFQPGTHTYGRQDQSAGLPRRAAPFSAPQ
ncbi:unnamed protein product, partial [Rangifer tarandus platyrhynchus]